MSLINQMLLDLDKRGGTLEGGPTQQTQVRPVALPAPKPRWPWLVGGAAALAACAAGGWHFLASTPAQPAAPASAPGPVPVAAPAAPASVALPVQAADTNASAPASVAPGLKLAFDLEKLPLSLPPVEPAVRKSEALTVAPAAVPKAEPAQPPRPPAPVANVPATPAAAPAAAAKPVAEPQPPAALQAAKEITPAQRVDNDYRRAILLMQQQGNSPEVLAALEKVLQQDPRHAGARQTLAGLLLQAKRNDEAVRVLQDGLALDADQPGLAMILGRLQVDAGDARTAIGTLQRSLPYAEERADYRAFLAALLQRENRHKEAAQHYQAALRKTPNNGLWWMGLGISLQADGRSAEAQEAYLRAKSSGSLSADLTAFVDQKLGQLPR